MTEQSTSQVPSGEQPPAPPRRRKLRRRLLLSLLALVFALAAAEAVLQIVGVEIRASRLVRDPILGWRNRPGWVESNFSINSRGILGPEFAAQKPPGTIRILCLGDSCTAGDLLRSFDETYPRQLQRELRQRYPGRSFEVVNAGVGGYSSFQGRLWLERELIDYDPDLAVIYFGWNDHWPARLGGPDKEVLGSLGDRIRAWLGWCKLLQLAIKAYHIARGQKMLPAGTPMAPGVPQSGRPARVSLEDYAENLRAMIRAMRDRGGEAVLVTAPSYLEFAEREGIAVPSVPGGAAAVAALVRLHAKYNAVVRRVAQEEQGCLVDAAQELTRMAEPAKLFWRRPGDIIDFIHLSAEGYGRLAGALATCSAVRRLAEAK